ncbi:uncharacterized protein PHACADRAFT_193578, partial [Phanerochaete carnosa HHB-10118-sp]
MIADTPLLAMFKNSLRSFDTVADIRPYPAKPTAPLTCTAVPALLQPATVFENAELKLRIQYLEAAAAKAEDGAERLGRDLS